MRLLADDLTGALDSAAALATPRCRIPVLWQPERALPAVAAIDPGTQEMDGDRPIRRHDRLADGLLGGEPAFKKIDSRMRGNWTAELAALSTRMAGWHLVVAPPFPFSAASPGRAARGR
ncbi:four-carbon acid sugar kinase family protein [Ancylobacter sp. SL191]|uniref:four-carbon acid sugar kinase family protein n=1 Tax=Ancylobacter sp. SL191 TaxID=2995166 RepID=UPI003B6354FD